MSLRASAAIPLELPARLWVDRVSDAAGLITAGAVAWVCSRHLSAGATAALFAVVVLALALARRGRPAGRQVEIVPGAASRRLGATLVVSGRSVGTGRTLPPVWLTPFDLPADQLRRLAVRLRALHRKVGS